MTGKTILVAVGLQPVVWTVLGVQFEAASMTAGLASCLIVRVWIALNNAPSRAWGWGIDLSVTAITLLFTAGWIGLERPVPFYAMLSGTGFGALGTGIITIALGWMKRIGPLAHRDPSPPEPEFVPDTSLVIADFPKADVGGEQLASEMEACNDRRPEP